MNAFRESEWVWIPHSEKWWGVELYRAALRRRDELSDPPICHLSCVCPVKCECMPELGHHPSCISPQWQFPLLFSRAFLLSWAELSEVTEQLGVEEECEQHYCSSYTLEWDIGKKQKQQLICLKMNNTTKSTSQMFSDSKCQKKRLTPTLPIGHMTASIFYLSINQAPNFQNCCHSTSFWKEVPYLSNHVSIPISQFWSFKIPKK